MKTNYLNLPAHEFIKFIANHRGGHAFQLKAMAMRWLNSERGPSEPRKDTIARLTDEIKTLRSNFQP